MVFVLDEYVKYFTENMNKYLTSVERRMADEANAERKKLELKIVTASKPCTFESNLYKKLDDIRDSNLSRIYDDQFYSEGFMRFLAELSCPIYYPLASSGDVVKHWMRNFKKIGAESAEGVAIRASLSDDDQLFIIKGPREEDNDLAHEAVVGLALNPLRAKIPNFSWVFGVIRCSIPVVENNQLVSWCSKKDPVTYVVYERIPGISMREFLATCTVTDFIDVYLQVLQSLHVAYSTCQFTHYDLHCDNIIIRPLKERSTIVYDLGNVTFYHTTTNIATFIDYGFAHIIYQGKHFGRNELRAYSAFPDRGNPIFDAFKLLCFSALYAQNNAPVYNVISSMTGFFTTTSLDTIVVELSPQKGYYYNLPYQLWDSFNLESLINFILDSHSPDFITYEPINAKILSCSMSGTCLDTGAIAKHIGLEKSHGFTTIEGYKFALEAGGVDASSRNKFNALFNQSLYKEVYYRIRTEMASLFDLIRDTKVIAAFTSEDMALKNLADKNVREMYKQYVIRVVDMVSKYDDIIAMFYELIQVMDDLGYNTNVIRTQMNNFIGAFRPRISTLTSRIINDINVIRVLSAYNDQEEFAWFFHILPAYESALVLD